MKGKNIFQQVQVKRIQRNSFDLSHDVKLTCNMGELIPVLVQDVGPGDTWKQQTEQMARMMPLIAPVMHKVKITQHTFFVPYRLLWPEWEDFITGGEHGDANPTFPYLTHDELYAGCLGDYLGLPTLDGVVPSASAIKFGAMPIAAYAKIYDEYYRDQNLSTKQFSPLEEGNNNAAYTALIAGNPLKRAWMHDYFTSALPEPQKGGAVSLPLGGEADIEFEEGTTPSVVRNPLTGDPILDADILGTQGQGLLQNKDDLETVALDNSHNLKVNLATATAATINDLRTAMRLQEWLELNARGGARYTESIYAHFGVKNPDSRLQRPEYIGGGVSNMIISEVLQQSQTEETGTPQGTMAGHGINIGETRGTNYFVQEHGIIMTIMSVMPNTAYQQGIPKMYSKFDKTQFYWRQFANLGEQPVLNQEIFAYQDPAEREEPFGYLPQYAEYKYIPSTVHGEMKTTLNFWHMGRIFTTPPQLNDTFIKCDPTTRIFAVEDDSDKIIVHIVHRIRAIRPMPYYGTPML